MQERETEAVRSVQMPPSAAQAWEVHKFGGASLATVIAEGGGRARVSPGTPGSDTEGKGVGLQEGSATEAAVVAELVTEAETVTVAASGAICGVEIATPHRSRYTAPCDASSRRPGEGRPVVTPRASPSPTEG